jgi:hypothetical protein
MSSRDLRGRRHLQVIFGLFLASGVTVGAYFSVGRCRLDPTPG